MAVFGGSDIKEDYTQGAKKVTFKACHSGKLKLEYNYPNDISTSSKIILMSRNNFGIHSSSVI